MKKFFLLSIFLLATSCTDDNAFTEGKRQLEAMGYTDIKNTGYSAFCCSKDDDFSTGFYAKDQKGNVTTGCFCSSLFKGVTIRYK